MKGELFTCFFLLIKFSCFAQENIYCDESIALSTEKIINYEYYLYEPKLIIKKEFKDLDEIKNLYPEELLKSDLSATDQRWVNFNYGKKKKKKDSHFEAVKRLNVDKNYYELISKLTFEYRNEKYAIIKFYIVFEELTSPLGVWRIMKYKKDRWILTSNNYTTNLGMLVSSFDSKKLKILFFNEPSNKVLIKELKNKIYTGNILSMEKLLIEFNEWVNKDDVNKKKFFLDLNRLPIN